MNQNVLRRRTHPRARRFDRVGQAILEPDRRPNKHCLARAPARNWILANPGRLNKRLDFRGFGASDLRMGRRRVARKDAKAQRIRLTLNDFHLGDFAALRAICSLILSHRAQSILRAAPAAIDKRPVVAFGVDAEGRLVDHAHEDRIARLEHAKLLKTFELLQLPAGHFGQPQ